MNVSGIPSLIHKKIKNFSIVSKKSKRLFDNSGNYSVIIRSSRAIKGFREKLTLSNDVPLTKEYVHNLSKLKPFLSTINQVQSSMFIFSPFPIYNTQVGVIITFLIAISFFLNFRVLRDRTTELRRKLFKSFKLNLACLFILMLTLNLIPILENKAVFNQFIIFKKPISRYYDEASLLGDGSFITVYELPQSYDFKNNTNVLKSNLLSPRELFNKDQKWQQVGWSNTPVKAKDFKYIAFATYDVLNSREEIKLAKILKTATVLLEREHNIYSFLKQEHDVEGHREKLISNIILIIFDLKGNRLYLIEHHT